MMTNLRSPDGRTLKYVLILSLSVVLFLTIGIVSLLRAATIARFYRNHYASHRYLRALFPIGRMWAESRYYETWIRVWGAFMILMAVFLATVMIRGLLR